MKGNVISIGTLFKTCEGVFGVVRKFNNIDRLYTIVWSNGLRGGESIIYDKQTIDFMFHKGSFKVLVEGEKVC